MYISACILSKELIHETETPSHRTQPNPAAQYVSLNEKHRTTKNSTTGAHTGQAGEDLIA